MPTLPLAYTISASDPTETNTCFQGILVIVPFIHCTAVPSFAASLSAGARRARSLSFAASAEAAGFSAMRYCKRDS
jgi:ABC-type dipeptide/oligopeptide/nickel transport system permease subunit